MNNRVGNFLQAVYNGSACIIVSKDSKEKRILGSSVNMNFSLGEKVMSPIILDPPRIGVEELIVIEIVSKDSVSHAFIRYNYNDGVPYAAVQDSDMMWLTSNDAVYKIYYMGAWGHCLAVRIDGVWYGNSGRDVPNMCSLPRSAGNLLCRYLVSKGEEMESLAQEIKEQASSYSEEKTAKEQLSELQQENERLLVELATEKLRIASLAFERDVYKQEHTEVSDLLNKKTAALIDMKNEVYEAIAWLRTNWWHIRGLKAKAQAIDVLEKAIK